MNHNILCTILLSFLFLNTLSLQGRNKYLSSRPYIYVNKLMTYGEAEAYCAKIGGGKGGGIGECSRGNTGLAKISNANQKNDLIKSSKMWSRCRRVWVYNNRLDLNEEELEKDTYNPYKNKNKNKCPYIEKFCGLSGTASCKRKSCFVCNNPNFKGVYDFSYATGDPHFIKCWRKTLRMGHDFQGISGCTYLLITPCKKDYYKEVPFEISARFKQWGRRRHSNVIENVYLKLFNRKTGKKELMINFDRLSVNYYNEKNDGITPNYFDNGNSYYLAKQKDNTRSLEIYIGKKGKKGKKICFYDMRIDATKVRNGRQFFWSVRLTLNRDKYLNKICGLFGYFQTNRRLFFVTRDNLALPLSGRYRKQWGQSYLDDDTDCQSRKRQCYAGQDVSLYLDEIPDGNDPDGSAMDKCKQNSLIKKLCSTKFETECKPLENDKCDLSSELSSAKFVKDCIFDSCSKCIKQIKNGQIKNMKDFNDEECSKGEAEAFCEDYCEQEQIHFHGRGDNQDDEVEDGDEFIDDMEFSGLYNHLNQVQTMDNNNTKLLEYNYQNLFMYAAIIFVIFSMIVCYVYNNNKNENNGLYQFDME